MNFSTIENAEIIIYECGHIIWICDRLKFWTSLTQIRELSHNNSWNMEWSYKITNLMIKIKSVSNVSIAIRLTPHTERFNAEALLYQKMTINTFTHYVWRKICAIEAAVIKAKRFLVGFETKK